MKRTKQIVALMMAMAMVFSMAACGGGSGSTTTTAGTEAAQTNAADTTAAAGETTAAAGNGEVKTGGVFRSSENVVPMSFFTVTASSTNADLFIAPAVEPLLRIYKDGTYDYLLAESMERDDEALTLTIKLREGIKFTDGSDLNAEVLKWTIDTALEAGRSAALANPTGCEIVDDYTVKIQFASFSLEWETLIGKMYMHSKKAYEENGEEWCQVNMVGTGPYKLDQYVQDTKLVFVRNDDYWQGTPYMDGLEIHCITDTTTASSSFVNKEVDFLQVTDSNVMATIKAAGYSNVAKGYPSDVTLGVCYPNSTIEGDPFNNAQVRQAVFWYGIDWAGVANASQGEVGYATNQFGIKGSYHFDETLEERVYDLEKAKSMLAEAGYADGFETTIWTTASTVNDATALQACLTALNINAKVETVTTLSDLRESGTEAGILLGLSPGFLDIASTLKRVYCRDGSYGKVLGTSDEYEKTLNEVLSAKTMEEKQDLLKKCSRMLSYEDAVLFATWAVDTNYFQQDYVEGLNRPDVAYGYSCEKIWLNK
ncbi:ABC transporter substrate-binding protein [Hominifimenecus sp. rT4P-3]|uniref:ABC transporter substrate-binding protein n=1 Tax=Hominifimenecus sp. rT4P-3 TaxID=3242979 RepID=UPI003DA48B07